MKKKILVVSNMFPDKNNPSYGVFVEKFCVQLDKNDISHDLCIMKKSKNKIDKIIGYFVFYVKSFIKTLLGNYDIVYVHYPSYSGLAVDLATRLTKKRVYSNLHGSDVIPENIRHSRMQKYTKKLLDKSERVVVPSQYFKELVSSKYKIDKSMIYVYPSGGVDPDVFYRKDKITISEFKNKYGIDEDKAVIGMAGRISKNKGWDVFVDAVEYVYEDVSYVIVGSGNEDVYLKRKLESIGKRVIWINELLPQSELATFYNVCDYFVFPTKREGESLGLVAIEAMACGTPVIASDYAAPKYYIIDGKNGFKFKVGSSDELAKTIRKALSCSKDEKEKLCENAYKFSSVFFCNNLNESLLNIFE